MAENNSDACAGCLRVEEENRTDLWCNECSEMVCESCAKVHRRFSSPHVVVPFHLRRKESITDLSHYCEIHVDHDLTLYCNDHDQNLCKLCVTEMHHSCKPVSIEEVAKGINDEEIMLDLKRRILNLSRTMEKIMAELANGLSNLDGQRKKIRDTTSELRTRINFHLNNIEADLLNQLSERCNEFENKTSSTIKDIRVRYENLTTWRSDDVTSVRSYASDIDLFKTSKFLDSAIKKHESFVRDIETTAASRKLDYTPLDIENIASVISSFGKISVVDTPISSTNFSEHEDKKVSLVNSFRTTQLAENVRVFRSCFVPGKRILLCAFNRHCLYACKHDGSDAKVIELDYQPLGVAKYDKNHAIATLGGDGMQIIDLIILSAGRKIYTEGNCWAISILNGDIWVRTDAWTLSQVDLNGQILQKITTRFDPRDFFMSSEGGIYSSSNYGDALFVMTSNGEQREFYSSPDLKLPKGVVVDKNGCVYVDGYISYNIHKITPDGKGEIVLTLDDGINQPRGMTYDEETHELLVMLNDGDTVNIYKLN